MPPSDLTDPSPVPSGSTSPRSLALAKQRARVARHNRKKRAVRDPHAQRVPFPGDAGGGNEHVDDGSAPGGQVRSLDQYYGVGHQGGPVEARHELEENTLFRKKVRDNNIPSEIGSRIYSSPNSENPAVTGRSTADGDNLSPQSVTEEKDKEKKRRRRKKKKEDDGNGNGSGSSPSEKKKTAMTPPSSAPPTSSSSKKKKSKSHTPPSEPPPPSNGASLSSPPKRLRVPSPPPGEPGKLDISDLQPSTLSVSELVHLAALPRPSHPHCLLCAAIVSALSPNSNQQQAETDVQNPEACWHRTQRGLIRASDLLKRIRTFDKGEKEVSFVSLFCFCCSLHFKPTTNKTSKPFD